MAVPQDQVGDDDLLGDVLHLEDQYYKEGYSLGVTDGTEAGRIEGRVFGLEKGFEKYLGMGKLAGQCAVWKWRLDQKADSSDMGTKLPALAENTRLAKHIQTLSSLVDTETLSHENTEEAVAEFDERLKAASGKARVIANIIREPVEAPNMAEAAAKDHINMEDFIALRPTR